MQHDGITVVPQNYRELLVWDATCPDTFAPSHSSSATREAGAMTALAEERKMEKYTNDLNHTHTFTSVATKTARVFGPWGS